VTQQSGQANGAAAADRVLKQEGASKTILIVEDNELNMKLFHDLLEMRGYAVLQARDGVEGLKLARQHRPDLIVMDIQLPGVSGLIVAKSIKDDAELKSIPIIAVTAFALKGDEEQMLAHGCEAYLAKPIATPVFLKTIAQFLG
jgi:two-component system cell cycle response regulator DivK